MGIGLTLQVLVLVVQNDASRNLVGTATAANNFFREFGASLGIKVVGTLSTARLTARPATGEADPVAHADSLTPIFAWLAPLCRVAIVLVAVLRPVPLRTTIDDQPAQPAPATAP